MVILIKKKFVTSSLPYKAKLDWKMEWKMKLRNNQSIDKTKDSTRISKWQLYMHGWSRIRTFKGHQNPNSIRKHGPWQCRCSSRWDQLLAAPPECHRVPSWICPWSWHTTSCSSLLPIQETWHKLGILSFFITFFRLYYTN